MPFLKGRTWITRVRDRADNGRRLQFSVGTDRARAERVEADLRQLIEYRDDDEPPPPKLLARVTRALQPRALERLAEAHLVPRSRAVTRTTLTQDIEDFLAHMATHGGVDGQGVRPRTLSNTAYHLHRILDGRWAYASKITGAEVDAVLDSVQEERGWSESTRSLHKLSVRSMLSWLHEEGRIEASPLAGKAHRVKLSSESDRRALSPEEQKSLVVAAMSAPTVGRMSGPERRLAYELAMRAGLRLREALFVTRAEFTGIEPGSANGRPQVACKASRTKNGKTQPVPLPPDLASRVWRQFRERGEMLPGARLFDATAATATHMSSGYLAADLKLACISKLTAEGRVDFHALRVTYVTNLARNGATVTQAAKLARHSDVNMTASIYTRFGFGEDADLVEAALPPLTGTEG